MVSIPLIAEGKTIGFLGADNIPLENMSKIIFQLNTMAFTYANYIMKQRLYLKMQTLSIYDSLTGLLNHNSYISKINNLKNTITNNLGVVFLDINKLKYINDNYGHKYGDDLIKYVSKKITESFDQYLCYRIGGDEFVVLCINISKSNFENLVLSFYKKILFKNWQLCSIGTSWSKNPSDINSIIISADKNMYKDKNLLLKNKNLYSWRDIKND